MDKTELFERMPIPKAVMKMAIPAIAATLITVLYNMADTFFVGQLNNEYQTAAVTLAANVTLAFNAVANLFGIGGASLMGRSLGEKDYDVVRKTASFSVWATISAGLLFSVVYTIFKNPILSLVGADEYNIDITKGYLFYTCTLGALPAILQIVLAYLMRTEGEAIKSTLGTIMGCILNIIIDPFFVLPQFLNMGAAGAGYATFISNMVACLYYIVIIIRKKNKSFICLDPRKAIPDKHICGQVFSVGVPGAIQNLLNVTGMTILNNFTSEYGSAAVSAMGIAHKIYIMPLYVSMAVAQGASPIVSYNYGSKNYNRAKECVKFTGTISTLWNVVLAIICYVFAGDIISAFIEVPEVVDIGTVLVRSMCIGIPFLALDFLGVGVYQALGYGSLCLLFAIARKIVLEIPALIVFNNIRPLYGMAYAAPFTEIILAVAAVIVLVIIFRRLDREKEKL